MRRTPLFAGLALAAALVPAAAAGASHEASAPEPRTPIRHFITLMQENHSFDNYFGTYAGADGPSKRTCMPIDPSTPRARCVRPFRVGNRPVEDLSDSPQTIRSQLNNGRMNGFISAITNQRGRVQPLVMGHYDDRDIPFYWNVADQYVLFDRFFASAPGGSLTNHMYWVTGSPGDKQMESIPEHGFDAPTIFDRLDAEGISWKFYVQNYDSRVTFRSKRLGDRGGQLLWVPLLNYPRFVDDRKRFAHIVPLDQLSQDMRRGTLPAVSYVVPSGSREQPPSSLTAGENLIRSLLNDLMRSRYWRSSAFTWTYDGSGGWFDHVRPPRGYGLRVPALLVSPYAKRGHIEHARMDFTSIVKFIEENWDLAPLTARDRRANSLMSAFDFELPPRPASFVTRQRHPDPVPEGHGGPVYLTYGIALSVAIVVILLAHLRELAVHRRRPQLRGPSRRIRIHPKRDG